MEEGARIDAVFRVLDEAAASIEPGDGTFNDPALGLDDKALGVIGKFDDFECQAAHGLGDAT